MGVLRKKKRLGVISFTLVFLMLIGMFSVFFTLSAEAAEYEYTAFSKLATEVDEETLYKKEAVIDSFESEDNWIGSAFVKSIGPTDYTGGTRCLLATADNEMRRSLGMSRSFESLTCEDYSEIYLAVIALGGIGYNYEFEVVIHSGGDEHIYTVTLSPNEWHDVFLDISDISVIDSVDIMARGIGTSARLTSIALSAFVMGDRPHGEFAQKFSAIDVTGATMTEDGISVKPEGTDAVVRANAILPSSLQTAKNSTVIMSVRISGLSYAKMGVATSPDPVWKTTEYIEKASVTVTADADSYVCCFPVEGRIVSWALTFSGITSDEEFVIEEVGILTGEAQVEEYAIDTALGTVTRCSFIKNGELETVQIEGNLTRDAAVGYIDGEICLYMVPAYRSVTDVLAEEPLMTIGTSTDFKFSIDLASNQGARASRFVVAVRNDVGTVCITVPISPVPLSTAVNSKVPSAVVSADEAAEVFLSGAGGTVIDIPLDRLILSSAANNAKLTAWGDSYVYLDRARLASLESLTEFYASCGIEVYFRLCVTQSDIFISAEGKSAAGYALDVSTKQNADTLCAAVEYLSSNFAPAGYMIGHSLNSAGVYYSAKFADIFDYMKSQAEVARCVYSIASSHDPQSIILLPFNAVGEEELETSYGELPAYQRSAYCAALADYYTGAYQTPMRWAAVTAVTKESGEDVTPATSNLPASGFLGTAFALDGRNARSVSPLTVENIAETYPNAIAVFTDGGEFAEVAEHISEVNLLPYDHSVYSGSLGLWDFSKSFMTYSWALSDGSNPSTQVSSALTDVMPFSTCRALHLDMDAGEDGGTVVAAAKFPYTSLDLSICSDVELLMTADSMAGDGEVSFTVMIGDGETRCVFPVTVASGRAVSVMCHVDTPIVPEYFAIVSDEACSVNIASVSAKSRTMSDAQLAEAVVQNAPAVPGETEGDEDTFVLLAITALGVFSALTLAILSKKKR